MRCINLQELNSIIKRYFTLNLLPSPDKTVYDLFKWKKVTVQIKDYKTNQLIVDMKDLEFPEHYSQNACDIIASKYFRKLGVPNKCGYENSLKMVVHRIVSFWLNSLVDEGIINTEEEKSIFYDEMAYAFLNQMYAPNSPQWFNTGIAQEYNIKGEKNNYFYYDEKQNKVIESDDSYTRTQASACFIVSINDKLLGNHSISDQFTTEIKLFKGGSGTGTNFSTLRAKGELLSGGGVSSGVMSFLKAFDRTAGAIKSGGTTRRAAKMVCLDIDHPEIMDFISWKAKEEDKVRALGKMGYDTDINGEAYETVSGQNSNNSVRFSDEFMEKVQSLKDDENQTTLLKGRIDPALDTTIKVKDLWNTFNDCSWQCADPAAQFTDRFNAWHTCPCGEDGKPYKPYNMINSTNPCGEYAFLDDSSCNLASINLLRFYDNTKKVFDIEGYLHVISFVQLALEASIHWGQYPTEDIARKTYMFRPTGLGITNLAALLMILGFAYDSEESRNTSAALTGILTGYSYFISSLMAQKVGTFEKYDINKTYMLRVLRNHARAAGTLAGEFENLNYIPKIVNQKLLSNIKLGFLSEYLNKSWKLALEYGEKYGYRNAQVTAIAPTGTISLAMDCISTSVEPFFSHIAYKKLFGGGVMTITNPVVEDSLRNLRYSENQIKDIINYMLDNTNSLENAPHLKHEHLDIFDTAAGFQGEGRYISPLGHVLMVASLTPLVSGAISKTVNLPSYAEEKDFKNVYLTSWQLGIKGITLYRNNSKASQPLNLSLSSDNEKDIDNYTYAELKQKLLYLQNDTSTARRDKPIGIRKGTTHPAQIEDVKIYTTINRNQNRDINEIYITTDREGTIITGLLNSLSKSISVMLQYHVPAKDISKMLRGQKYEPYGLVQMHPFIKYVTSISDLISKIIDIELGDYSRCQIKPRITHSKADKITAADTAEEKVYGAVCPNCSSTNMIRTGTCMVCKDCGSTTGCS